MTNKSPATAKTRLHACGNTDAGRVRKNNEDTFYCDDERGIFMVVDGMGGHNAGEVAARIAVETVKRVLRASTDETGEKLRRAINQANNEICAQAAAQPDWQGMQCVLTVAMVEGDKLTVGHVGDTRLYIIRGGAIRKVTHDHSPVGILEELKQVSEIEAMQLPNRNQVLKSLGSEVRAADEQEFAELSREEFQSGDAILLCSDGLSDLLTSERIRRIVEEHNGYPAAIVNSLIEAANEEGGKDNITVVYALKTAADAEQRGLAGLPGRALALSFGFFLGALAVWMAGRGINKPATVGQSTPTPVAASSKTAQTPALSQAAPASAPTPNDGQAPLKDSEEIAAYTQVLELQKKALALLLARRSQAYQRNGQAAQARQDCEAAGKLDPSRACERPANDVP